MAAPLPEDAKEVASMKTMPHELVLKMVNHLVTGKIPVEFVQDGSVEKPMTKLQWQLEAAWEHTNPGQMFSTLIQEQHIILLNFKGPQHLLPKQFFPMISDDPKLVHMGRKAGEPNVWAEMTIVMARQSGWADYSSTPIYLSLQVFRSWCNWVLTRLLAESFQWLATPSRPPEPAKTFAETHDQKMICYITGFITPRHSYSLEQSDLDAETQLVSTLAEFRQPKNEVSFKGLYTTSQADILLDKAAAESNLSTEVEVIRTMTTTIRSLKTVWDRIARFNNRVTLQRTVAKSMEYGVWSRAIAHAVKQCKDVLEEKGEHGLLASAKRLMAAIECTHHGIVAGSDDSWKEHDLARGCEYPNCPHESILYIRESLDGDKLNWMPDQLWHEMKHMVIGWHKTRATNDEVEDDEGEFNAAEWDDAFDVDELLKGWKKLQEAAGPNVDLMRSNYDIDAVSTAVTLRDANPESWLDDDDVENERKSERVLQRTHIFKLPIFTYEENGVAVPANANQAQPYEALWHLP